MRLTKGGKREMRLSKGGKREIGDKEEISGRRHEEETRGIEHPEVGEVNKYMLTVNQAATSSMTFDQAKNGQ